MSSRPLDICLSLTTVYFSVWLYEIGNWMSISVIGANPSMAWSGILPVGVVAVSHNSSSLLEAKVIQVGIATGIMFALWMLTSRKGLPITGVILAGTMGVYLASVYWEMLSLTSFMPIYVHEIIYAAISFGVTFWLLKALPGISYKVRSLRII